MELDDPLLYQHEKDTMTIKDLADALWKKTQSWRKGPGTLKTEINVPFGVLNVPLLKSPILGGNLGLFGPLFQRARLIWALEYAIKNCSPSFTTCVQGEELTSTLLCRRMLLF